MTPMAWTAEQLTRPIRRVEITANENNRAIQVARDAAQARVLAWLRDHGPSTVRDVAFACALTPDQARGLLLPLMRAGVVHMSRRASSKRPALWEVVECS